MLTFLSFGAGVFLLLLSLPYLVFFDKGRRSFLLAVRSLWLHKMRAFLSVLGIIIGTGAVIALMAFGEGSKQDALDDIKRLGATNIIVRSVKPPDDSTTQRKTMIAAYGVTQQDFESFEILTTVKRMVPMRIFPQEVRRFEKMILGRVVATTPEYTEVNQLDMAAGRFLTTDDDRLMENVAVLGWGTAQRLFPYDDPLDNQSIRIGAYPYRVIGIVRERMPTGGSGGSQAAEDYNSDVYIPLKTSRARFGDTLFIRQSGSRTGEKVYLHQITLTVGEMDQVRPTGEAIKELLNRHPKTDWALTVPLDKLEEAERTKNRYTQMLVLVGGISLLVGGIGIMNIMLATVTERTREIGIRRALGAKRRDITLQFLVEAMVQTTVGGMLGTALGLGFVYGLPRLAAAAPEMAEYLFGSSHVPIKVHVESILISVEVAVAVGVLFGWYPANRAARLDPIEALRHV